MSYHHEKVKKALVHRTAERLLIHGWPRVWMFLACAAAVFTWWSFSTTLVAVPSFSLRYGLCAIGAYVVWFAVIGAWRSMQAGIDSAEFANQATVDPRLEQVQFEAWRQRRREFFDDLYDAAGREMINDPKGALGVLLAVLVMGGPLVGMWLISFAPQFLSEFLVETGKVKHTTRYAPTPHPWYVFLLRRTGWFALALVLHYMLLAAAFQWASPHAVGLSDLPPPRR